MALKYIKDVLLIIIQIMIILFAIFLQYYFYKYFFNQTYINIEYVYIVLTIIEIILLIYMFEKQTTLEYVTLWLIFFIIFPVLAIFLYIIFSTKNISLKTKKGIKNISNNTKEKDENLLEKIFLKDISMYNTLNYINNVCKYSLKRADNNKYYKTGETFYIDFLNDIENAKKYIFINFFIIAKGKMLNEILEHLKSKAEMGVKVFIIFDHLGSLTRYPKELKKIKNKNFKICAFNPLSADFSLYLNIRNHRKIVVIDNKISYTGGLNIADEYINKGTFKAKWKDCAIRLEGSIADDFSNVFIELWNMYCKKSEKLSINEFDNVKSKNNDNDNNNEAYQIIYIDGIDTQTNVGKNLCSKLINDTQKNIYIMTPYLMLDNEILNSLKRCGRSGLNVNIITPKIGDNYIVHSITRAYYRELIENNVKIYEYIPGFIHSKIMLSDDIKASVSSINLDYRSMYYHYECGVLIYNDEKIIEQIRNDFYNTINESEEIDELWFKKHYFLNLFKPILKIIAPLM